MKPTPTSLRLITPPPEQFSAERFYYPNLKETVESRYANEHKTLEDRLELYGDDLWKGLDLRTAYRYLPVLTLRIQESGDDQNREYWSGQYTLATSRIFGQPDATEAKRLAANSLQELEQAAELNGVSGSKTQELFSVYRIIGGDAGSEILSESDESALLSKLSKILYRRYGFVYELLDNSGPDGRLLSLEQVHELFDAMFVRLSKEDKIWSGWQVALNDSAQMSVSPRRKLVNIGKHIPGLSVQHAKGLFTHEVLVHAARAAQGLVYADSLAYGLPGYSKAEEGLGVLMEAAAEGRRPFRIVDRYIDIALALGLLGLPPIPRPKLYEIARQRTMLRWQVEGVGIDQSDVSRIAWQHVNRIYKGTLGNNIVGVNTRDVIYYSGYKSMAEYLNRYKEDDLYLAVRFVLSGKMNPIDQEHRAYIHELKFDIKHQD